MVWDSMQGRTISCTVVRSGGNGWEERRLGEDMRWGRKKGREIANQLVSESEHVYRRRIGMVETMVFGNGMTRSGEEDLGAVENELGLKMSS